MGFFKLGRLERGKEKEKSEDAHEEERKKHEAAAKPASESRSGGTRVQAGTRRKGDVDL